MKIFKIVLFLLIGLALIGCNTGNNNNDDDNDDDDVVVEPTLQIESTDYLIKEEETLQLNVEILNSDEELGIIYISSNDIVASVSTEGLVTGKSVGFTTITIMLASYPDQKLEVIFTVEEKPEEVPEDIQRAILDFKQIKEDFSQIPDEITQDIRLDNYKYNRFITWSSSNEDAITKYGIVTRGEEDVQVELKATMTYKQIEEVFRKVVTVKKAEIRDLTGRKINFAYSRQIMMSPVHLQQIDVVNYSFASITAAMKFNVNTQIATLVRTAHNNGARVVAAVGGGDAFGSNPFKVMTENAANRKIFIDSAIEAIKKYKLDGIDYDWEFPNTTTERDNFSALVRETRAALDAYKPGLILSSAINAGTWSVNTRYDVKELNKYLDFFHIMTYDLNNFPGADNFALTRHHTGLYRSSMAPGLSSDEAIRAYVGAGASPEKVILGIAAYGRLATEITGSETGLNAMGKNPAQSTNYENIYNLYFKDPENSAYEYFFDDQAKAAWIFDGSTFISFDDERSIQAKCDYVYINNLGGTMYWDYMNDPSGRILDYIYKNLNN